MTDYTLVYVALITTVGGIIGALLLQRGMVTNWAMKMDFISQKYKHQQTLEGLKARKAIDLQQLKNEARSGNPNVLGQLGNLDLDQVKDIIDSLQGISEEGGILSNPIVQGLVKGFVGKGGKQEQLPAEFQGVQFEE
jgi:hypothetical protein